MVTGADWGGALLHHGAGSGGILGYGADPGTRRQLTLHRDRTDEGQRLEGGVKTRTIMIKIMINPL